MWCGGLDPHERLARSATETEHDRAIGWILPGCGREIDVPADRQDPATWDIRTEVTKGTEFVVERWHVVRCPFCGYEGDENRVDDVLEKPIPFELHEPVMEWARAVRLKDLSERGVTA